MILWKALAEEAFFFQYHLSLDYFSTMQLPILTRKWMIEKFIEQKEKENNAIESSKRKR